jgi:hypothetical protein
VRPIPFRPSHQLNQYLTTTLVLDAWLKGEDDAGWLKGPNVDVPAVSVLVRKGNPGFNTTEAEATFKFRPENEWPIARTRYVKHYLQSDKTMKTSSPTEGGKDFELQALGKGAPVNFEVKFEEETEINGHPTANLVYSVPKRADGSAPKDIDVFLTLRHLDANGREIYYTGTAGDPVPLCKGQYHLERNELTSRSHGVSELRRVQSLQAGSERPCARSTNPHLDTKTTSLTGITSRKTSCPSNRIPSTISW